MRLLLLGDSHGSLRHIRFAIEKAHALDCERIFSLGDTGMWVHCSDGQLFLTSVNRMMHEAGLEFDWLDGNHDPMRHVLATYDEYDDEGFLVMADHVRYAPRGHHWQWGMTRFCSLGGAYSIDEWGRRTAYAEVRQVFRDAHSVIADDELDLLCKPYEQWWPEELISDKDVDKAIAGGKIDVLLSHDTGTDVDITGEFALKGHSFRTMDATESNRRRVQRVIDKCQPHRAFNGHYHLRWNQRIHGCDYTALDCNLNPKESWTVLEV
jgi:hypothetical protein